MKERDPARREILHDLDIAAKEIFDKDGKPRPLTGFSKPKPICHVCGMTIDPAVR